VFPVSGVGRLSVRGDNWLDSRVKEAVGKKGNVFSYYVRRKGKESSGSSLIVFLSREGSVGKASGKGPEW